MSDSDRPSRSVLRWRFVAPGVVALAVVALSLTGMRGLRVGWLSSQVQKPRSEDEETLTRRLLESSYELDLEADRGGGDRLWAASVAHHEKLAGLRPERPFDRGNRRIRRNLDE